MNGAGGSGQTIAIVDAYDDPKIERDLAAFDTHYGMPRARKPTDASRRSARPGKDVAAKSGHDRLVSRDLPRCGDGSLRLPQMQDPARRDRKRKLQDLAGRQRGGHARATEVSNSYGGPEAGLGPDRKGRIQPSRGSDRRGHRRYGYNDWNMLNEDFEPPGHRTCPHRFRRSSRSAARRSSRTEGNAGERDGVERERPARRGRAEAERQAVAAARCSRRALAAGPRRASRPPAAANKRLAADVSAGGDPPPALTSTTTTTVAPSAKSPMGRRRLADDRRHVGGHAADQLALRARRRRQRGRAIPALTLYGHLGEPVSLYDVTEGGNGICDDEAHQRAERTSVRK